MNYKYQHIVELTTQYYFRTQFFKEQLNGILIMAYNPGESNNDKINITTKPLSSSFFSDERNLSTWPFNRKIEKFFSLWGFPLETRIEKISKFEKSIFQSNWCLKQLAYNSGKDLQLCLENKDFFVKQIQIFKPKILLLFGKQMIYALNNSLVLPEIERIIGVSKPFVMLTKKIENCKKFKIYFQEFRNMNVIVFPHPTGSIGIQDKYIAAFSEEITPIFERFLHEIDMKSSLS